MSSVHGTHGTKVLRRDSASPFCLDDTTSEELKLGVVTVTERSVHYPSTINRETQSKQFTITYFTLIINRVGVS